MRIHLSLGSNIGGREANLRAAIEQLDKLDGVRVTAQSRLYETEPVGVRDQPAFLNMAAEVETDLEPLELLAAIQELEQRLQRTRDVRWGPRTIDVDIVLWGDEVRGGETLSLPHQAFRERAFVLAPLNEIAPEAVDPVTGRTVAELAAAPGLQGAVLDVRERPW